MMWKQSVGVVLWATLALGVCGSATAGTVLVPDGLYQLHNHPDSANWPQPVGPMYGLWLNGLIGGDAEDIFTFSFDGDGADVKMQVDGTTIHVFGQVFGGLDIGSQYDPDLSGLWDLDFTYTDGAKIGGDDDLGADVGSGTIVAGFDGSTAGSTETLSVTSGESFDLIATRGTHEIALRVGDENDDAGHRGNLGVSGWGWLNHSGAEGGLEEHIEASDWLFAAEQIVIPEPSTLGLLAVAGLVLRRRRRA